MHQRKKNSLGFYVAYSEKNLIRGVSAAETINTREIITSVEFKKHKAKELKEKWSKAVRHHILVCHNIVFFEDFSVLTNGINYFRIKLQESLTQSL